MSRTALPSLRRSVPTVAVASALLILSATSGATAALVITGKQIKDNTITTADIKNGTLNAVDLAPATVSALKGATGAAGRPGISGYQLITESVNIAPGDSGGVQGSCPVGKRVLGVASSWNDSYDGTQTTVDISTTNATAYGVNYLDSYDLLTIDVICANVA